MIVANGTFTFRTMIMLGFVPFMPFGYTPTYGPTLKQQLLNPMKTAMLGCIEGRKVNNKTIPSPKTGRGLG